MNETAQVTATQVLVMFLLMSVGFIAVKTKMLTSEGSAQMNKLLLNFVTPAVLLNSFNREFEWELLRALGMGTLLFTLGMAIALGCAFALIRGKSERRRVERFAVVFSNCGFMGIPLIQAVLGDNAVVFASCGVMAFNIGAWTFGRLILAGGGGSWRETARKAVLNPGVIGSLLGILLFCLPVTLPRPLASAVGHVANLNTPLAMIVIGGFVARADIKSALASPGVWKVAALRLLVVPALTVPFYLLLKAPHDAATASYIMTCAPSAALVSMFSNLLGLREGEQYGPAIVSVTTLLSIVTIPLMMLLTPYFII